MAGFSAPSSWGPVSRGPGRALDSRIPSWRCTGCCPDEQPEQHSDRAVAADVGKRERGRTLAFGEIAARSTRSIVGFVASNDRKRKEREKGESRRLTSSVGLACLLCPCLPFFPAVTGLSPPAAAAAAAACCAAVFLRPRSEVWIRTGRLNSSEREKLFSHLRGYQQHRSGSAELFLYTRIGCMHSKHLGREYDGRGAGRAGGDQEDGFRCWAGVKRRSSFSRSILRVPRRLNLFALLLAPCRERKTYPG